MCHFSIFVCFATAKSTKIRLILFFIWQQTKKKYENSFFCFAQVSKALRLFNAALLSVTKQKSIHTFSHSHTSIATRKKKIVQI